MPALSPRRAPALDLLIYRTCDNNLLPGAFRFLEQPGKTKILRYGVPDSCTDIHGWFCLFYRADTGDSRIARPFLRQRAFNRAHPCFLAFVYGGGEWTGRAYLQKKAAGICGPPCRVRSFLRSSAGDNRLDSGRKGVVVDPLWRASFTGHDAADRVLRDGACLLFLRLDVCRCMGTLPLWLKRRGKIDFRLPC